MSDCVLIPLQDVGVLALTREACESALAAGSDLVAAEAQSKSSQPEEGLLDAEQAAFATRSDRTLA